MLTVLTLRMTSEHSIRSGGPGFGFLDRYARDLPGAERVSFSTLPASFTGYVNGERVRSSVKRTDGEFFRVFRFEFVEGGPFTAEDDRNASRVAVVNEATRDRYFGGGPALGRTLDVQGDSFRVVGVVRNVPNSRLLPFSDVWVPLGTTKGDAYRREFVGDMMAVIVAKDRSAIPAIQDEFRSRLATAELPPPYTSVTGAAETFFAAISGFLFDPGGESRPERLWGLILGAGILFMTLPSLNLVNITLSRILERSSEIGVRRAFGASSGALVGQFVVESVLLSLAGGVVGFLLSAVALGVLNASDVIPYSDFALNPRILLYGVGIAVFFGLLSGVYPAWRMSRLQPVEALRGRSE
jgi:putative ABC transport system permease protein